MVRKNEITEIKVNVKRPDRRSIFIDGEFAFSISEGIFYDHGIKVGDMLTDDQIETLFSLDEREKIKGAALNLLSYRARSVRELRDRLCQKGWKEEKVESIILELKEKGFLDDREFANMLARDRTKLKFLGPRALKHELIKAGINHDLIEEVIEETYQKTTPESLMKALLKKKGIDFSKPIDGKEKTRLVNLFKRKGYSWDQIEPVISRLKTD